MGLFDFLRQLTFFRGRETAGYTADDIDFSNWVESHRDWRRRLSDHIHGTAQEELDESVICQDTHCELGKWLNGGGGQFYGDLPVFSRLRDNHAEFHRCAATIVGLCKSEGTEAAFRALHTDFDLISLKVMENLESLEYEVKSTQN